MNEYCILNLFRIFIKHFVKIKNVTISLVAFFLFLNIAELFNIQKQTMKKLSVLFIAFTMVLLSCSNDDTASTSAELTGAWNGQAISYNGTIITEVLGESIESTYVAQGYDIDFTMTFTEMPNNVVGEGNYSLELVSTTLGQSQTQNFEDLSFENNSTWTRDGNQLLLTDGTETVAYQITELTENKLVLTADSLEAIPNASASGITEIKIEIILTR